MGPEAVFPSGEGSDCTCCEPEAAGCGEDDTERGAGAPVRRPEEQDGRAQRNSDSSSHCGGGGVPQTLANLSAQKQVKA
ncbi:hypothetical protein Y1Q_0004050 [Alligator mississippiensis]|uniref:Uncharacterized protein n=1 Tax=Alligator mississippiensis TaxID=8496 RepID=A0A151PHS9_ALLMI|nr:hypothetical protein Y1Q_0004050 [Alligator mississippiensis]